MKKLILLLIIPLVVLITSCTDDPITQTPTGSIYLTSSPAGAAIWIDGSNTFKTTPDTINDVDEGVRSVTLKKIDYNDTTFSISISEGQTSVVGPVVLVSNIMTTLFGPVRIYETYNTPASQPSGLDLSTGMAYGVSSPEANLVDVYYSTEGTGGEGYLVR